MWLDPLQVAGTHSAIYETYYHQVSVNFINYRMLKKLIGTYLIRDRLVKQAVDYVNL